MVVALTIPNNAVVRTNPRWDRLVKHLGYISVDIPQGQGVRTLITDKELIGRSQEALRKNKIVPAYLLTPSVYVHLKLARAIASHFPGIAGVYASVIPPASDRVRTAGLYDRGTREIILHLETLEHVQFTIDAMVHELGHHIANMRVADPMQAEDLQPAHSEAMTEVADKLTRLATEEKFDVYLKEAVW